MYTDITVVMHRAPPGHVNAFGNNPPPGDLGFRGSRFPISRSGPPPRFGSTREQSGLNQSSRFSQHGTTMSGRAEPFVARINGSSSSRISGASQPHLLPRGLPPPPFMMMPPPPFNQKAPFFDAKFPPPPPPPPFRGQGITPFGNREGDKHAV